MDSRISIGDGVKKMTISLPGEIAFEIESNSFNLTCFRALEVGLKISRPPYHIGRFKMLRHVKSWRDDTISFSLFLSWKARFRDDGANSLDRDINYKVLAVENYPLYTNISVNLGEAPVELMKKAAKQPQMSLLSLLSFYFP